MGGEESRGRQPAKDNKNERILLKREIEMEGK
jgi:hypothetical protein